MVGTLIDASAGSATRFAREIFDLVRLGMRARAAQTASVGARRLTADGFCLAGASGLESDFRSLRTLVLTTDPVGLARIVPEAEISEFAEWSSWLPPIIDRLVAASGTEPLEAALAALRTTAAMKQTAPVRAQAERLAGHLAARAGDRRGADEAFARAHQLAAECELAFEAGVIGLERLEQTGMRPDRGLASIRATFSRLGAAAWLERAQQADDGQPASAHSSSSRHQPHPTA
jgi:hypothetical protein